MRFNGFLKRTVMSWVAVIAVITLFIVFFKDIFGFLKYIINLFLPFIIAYIVSLAVNPLAKKLHEKFNIPKGISAVLLIVLVVGIIGSMLFFAVFKIISEIRDLYLSIPQIYQNSTAYFENMSRNLQSVYMSLPDALKEVFDNMINSIRVDVTGFLKKSYTPFMSFFKDFALSIPRVFFVTTVFIISLYFMISRSDKINDKVKNIIPDCMKNTMKRSALQIKKYFGGYLKAQFILMLVALVIMFVGFLILDVKYSLLLAFGISLFDALPFFGTVMILIPWSIVGFLNGDFAIGIGMIVIYIVLVVVRELIEPKIVSTNIGISPLLTLISMYVGFNVFSIGGMILGPFVLMFIVSLYKAGVFDGIIRFSKKLYKFIIYESKRIFNNITMR